MLLSQPWLQCFCLNFDFNTSVSTLPSMLTIQFQLWCFSLKSSVLALYHLWLQRFSLIFEIDISFSILTSLLQSNLQFWCFSLNFDFDASVSLLTLLLHCHCQLWYLYPCWNSHFFHLMILSLPSGISFLLKDSFLAFIFWSLLSWFILPFAATTPTLFIHLSIAASISDDMVLLLLSFSPLSDTFISSHTYFPPLMFLPPLLQLHPCFDASIPEVVLSNCLAAFIYDAILSLLHWFFLPLPMCW